MTRPRLEITGQAERLDISDGNVVVVAPIRLKRRSGRRLVQMQAAPESSRPWDKQKTPLQVALMRAHRWLAMLEESEAASLSDIARREGTDVSYVARVLNLTTLAPEIVEAILDDALPNAVFLNDLAINTPESWSKQIAVMLGPAIHQDRCTLSSDSFVQPRILTSATGGPRIAPRTNPALPR